MIQRLLNMLNELRIQVQAEIDRIKSEINVLEPFGEKSEATQELKALREKLGLLIEDEALVSMLYTQVWYMEEMKKHLPIKEISENIKDFILTMNRIGEAAKKMNMEKQAKEAVAAGIIGLTQQSADVGAQNE